MPLDPSCEKYLGSLVYCIPIEYYGWNRWESKQAQGGTSLPVPNPFHARISEVTRHSGDLKGFVGTIHEVGHALDQLWVGFCIRDSYLNEETNGKLFFDLTSQPGKYNVVIGSEKPRMAIDYQKPMVEWMEIESCPIVRGVGYLTESVVSLEDIHAAASKRS